MPDHHALLASNRRKEQVVGGNDRRRVRKIEKRKAENAANFDIRPTTCTLIQLTRTERDRDHANESKSSPFRSFQVTFIAMLADICLMYTSTYYEASSGGTTQHPEGDQ